MGLGLENPLHIALIVVVVLLVFGAKRVPEIGRSLGEGIRGFKDSLSGSADRSPTTETESLTAQIAETESLAPPAAGDAAAKAGDSRQ
jgi:sec-independent protein translocase protein TatA